MSDADAKGDGIMFRMLVIVGLLVSTVGAASAVAPVVHAMLHTYEARIRLNGVVSTTRVKAKDSGHAKQLVQAQYGPSVTVLSVKRVD
jgi:phage baseplate assembly protein W